MNNVKVFHYSLTTAAIVAGIVFAKEVEEKESFL